VGTEDGARPERLLNGSLETNGGAGGINHAMACSDVP
jgi:hypothetical protein